MRPPLYSKSHNASPHKWGHAPLCTRQVQNALKYPQLRPPDSNYTVTYFPRLSIHYCLNYLTVIKDKLHFPTPPSQSYLRATGPKTVHAERTLHFLSPDDYRSMKAADKATRKQLSQQYGISLTRHKRSRTMSPVESAIVVNSINYEQR